MATFPSVLWLRNSPLCVYTGFLAGSVVKDPPTNTRDADWIPSLGWEDPLEKEMSTHSHSCLGNPTDKSAWWVTVQGVADELGTTWLLNKSGELFTRC